ncbi:MAG: hypothetical protein IKO47_04910 [Ruminococcus sp.]|nr:hypothetical protein [Ruminococcus sp.]
MNKRIIAMILSLGLAGTLLTACGDTEDDNSESGIPAASDEIEDITAEDTTEAQTEPETGKSGGISQRTETTTEKPSELATVPGDSGEICIDASDMIGMSVSDIAELLGSGYEIYSDGMMGHYRIYNYKKLPDVDFSFEDHTWDSYWNEDGFPNDKYAEIREKAAKSSNKVIKINYSSGVFDEFRVGMKYSDCAKIIGDFPVHVSDLGQTVCYEPSSVAYYYLNIYNNDCIVGLHFEYTDAIKKAVDAGRIAGGGSRDIAPADIKTYDPQLRVISIIYSPRIDTSDFSASASSSHDDITYNGIKYTYGPANLIDGRLDTCWCEGSTDVGIDQSVTLRSSRLMECKFITVYGGLMTSEEGFYKNCRPLAMDIAPEGVKDMTYYLPTNYNTRYRRSIPVGYIQWDCYDFVIKDVDSSRSKYSDTCISEIVFNG